MKKYLICGAWALIAGLFLVSCHEEDLSAGNVDAASKKKEEFSKAFVKAFGEISSSQNWGFKPSTALSRDNSVASTRSALATADFGRAFTRAQSGGFEETSEWLELDENDYNNTILKKLPEGGSVSNKTNNFEFLSKGEIEIALVYTRCGYSTYYIGFYYYDPSTQTAADKTTVQMFSTSQYQQIFQFYNGSWFNSWAPGNSIDPLTGNWNGEITKCRAKKFKINVPKGYRFGLYITNTNENGQSRTYYTNKSLNHDGNYHAVVENDHKAYLVGFEDTQYGNYDCNNLVFSIDKSKNAPTVVNNPSSSSGSSTDNTGNNGNAGGSTGNNGNSGGSTGNTGNTGNSGNTGDSGNNDAISETIAAGTSNNKAAVLASENDYEIPQNFYDSEVSDPETTSEDIPYYSDETGEQLGTYTLTTTTVTTTEEFINYDNIRTYEFAIEDKITESGRVFCEDLASDYASNRKDFDYNDIVFDGYIVERTYKRTAHTDRKKYHWKKITITSTIVDSREPDYSYSGDTEITYTDGNGNTISSDEAVPALNVEVADVIEENWRKASDVDTDEGTYYEPGKRYFAKVTLLAAGGTKAVSVLDQEVHNAFGVGETTMVNTFDSHSASHESTYVIDESTGKTETLSAFGSYTTKDPVRLENPDNPAELAQDDNAAGMNAEFQSKYLFEGYGSLIDIPIIVRFSGNDVLSLDATSGKAPQKIAVTPIEMASSAISSNNFAYAIWPSERFAIDEAYPNFFSFVNDNLIQDQVWSNGNNDCLYERGSAVPQCNEIEGSVIKSVSGQSSENISGVAAFSNAYDISKTIHVTKSMFEGPAKPKVGDYIRFYAKTNTPDDWQLIVSDGAANRLVVESSDNKAWTEYVNVYVTQKILTALENNLNKAAMILSGKNLMITNIVVVHK